MTHLTDLGARSLLQHLCAWALGGLPGWLVLPGLRWRWSRRIAVTSPANRVDVRPGELVDLALSSELLLCKDLTLPSASRGNLRNIVDLHVRQSTPGQGADLVWRYGTPVRNGDQMTVNIYVLKSRVLVELTQRVLAAGAQIRTVAVDGTSLNAPFVDRRARSDRPRQLWSALAVLLLLGACSLIFWRETEAIQNLRAEQRQLTTTHDRLAAKAVEARAAQSQWDAERTARLEGAKSFARERQRLAALVSLTEILDDKTWISNVTITGDQMRLSGFTGQDVGSLIDTLLLQDWIQTAELAGQVQFDPLSRQRRFELALGLE